MQCRIVNVENVMFLNNKDFDKFEKQTLALYVVIVLCFVGFGVIVIA